MALDRLRVLLNIILFGEVKLWVYGHPAGRKHLWMVTALSLPLKLLFRFVSRRRLERLSTACNQRCCRCLRSRIRAINVVRRSLGWLWNRDDGYSG